MEMFIQLLIPSLFTVFEGLASLCQGRPVLRYNREMCSGFARRLRSWLSWLGYILLSLLLIAVGEWLPFMPAVQRFQEAHPSINQALTGVILAMTVLGILLLAFTQFLLRVPGPRLASQAQTIKAEGKAKGLGWFFSGKG